MGKHSKDTYQQLVQESKRIIIYLGFQRYIYDSSFVDDVVSKLLEAEFRWSPLRGAKLSSYKIDCIRNLCRNYYRKSKNSIKITRRGSLYNIEAPSDQQYNRLLCKEIVEFVNRKCSIKQRNIFNAYFIEGYTTQEIATKLGVSRQAILQRIDKIRSSIKRKFGK